MPTDALKDRWEYRRWYPIVILCNDQKDAISRSKSAYMDVPERSQLPEHDGDDEDHLGHCGWGATVDTIGRSQVGTTEKNGIVPPNSRSLSQGRIGGHERATKGDKMSTVLMLNSAANSATAALNCRLALVV